MPTLRLRDSLSERSITSRCLPAMAPRVLAMRGEVRSRPAGQSLQQLFRSQPFIRLEHSITPPKKGRSLVPLQNKTYSIRVCSQLARRWINPPGVCEAAPTACAVVICFASCIGSANVLEFEHHREVCSVSGEVMFSQKGNATSIRPITISATFRSQR
jgi:hypothetical protein